MPFPATGPYKTHFGMFVGEVHDERETMEVLIQKMRILAGSVDVILLEYYPEGETPFLKLEDQIGADLERFNKTFNMKARIAKQVYRLWSMAYYFGIDVRGIEQPTPGHLKPGSMPYLMHRMSAEVNQAYLDVVDKYAQEKGRQSVRFCMYGGLVHWVKIKRLAPTITGYRINGTNTDLVAI